VNSIRNEHCYLNNKGEGLVEKRGIKVAKDDGTNSLDLKIDLTGKLV
jgi:hypothetical protein